MNIIIVTISVVSVIITIIALFNSIAANVRAKKIDRKNELDFLYETVIAPAHYMFFRASKFFILQKDLSGKDKKELEEKRTTQNECIHLINSIDRCLVRFSREEEFCKYIDLLHRKCVEFKGNKIYDYKEIDEEVLNPLYNLYKKHSKLNSIF